MKQITTIIIFLLLTTTATAYKTKYLHPAINQTATDNILNSIPEEEFEGVKVVSFYYCLNQYWDGLYIVGGVIRVDVCNGGVRRILKHNLRHNYCWNTEKYLGHEGCFITYDYYGQYLSNSSLIYFVNVSWSSVVSYVKNFNENL